MKKYLWGIFGLLVIIGGVSGNNETNTVDSAAVAAITSSPVSTSATTVSPTPSTTTEPTKVSTTTTNIALSISPTSSPTNPVTTTTPTPSVPAKPVITQTQTPKVSSSTKNNSYTNVDGQEVQSPVKADTAPDDATAQCKDGTYSKSLNRRGTCSGHGGVAKWL